MTVWTGLSNAGSPRDVDSPKLGSDPERAISACSIPESQGLPAFDWRRWAPQRESVERVLPLLGEQVKLDSAFPCVIPGHAEACSARVRFDAGERGSKTWRYRCGHRWRSLAEVRACVVAGRDLHGFRGGTQWVWFDRCALEAGLVESPVHVFLPRLSAELAERSHDAGVSAASVESLYDGFGLLLRVRRLRDPDVRDVMFTADFAGPWAAQSVSVAKKARLVLAQIGAIHEVGSYQLTSQPHCAKLWRLGKAEATR